MLNDLPGRRPMSRVRQMAMQIDLMDRNSRKVAPIYSQRRNRQSKFIKTNTEESENNAADVEDIQGGDWDFR